MITVDSLRLPGALGISKERTIVEKLLLDLQQRVYTTQLGEFSQIESVLEFHMSRRCQLTGKKANNAYAVSHSHRRTKKLQGVNLQSKRVWWPQGNRWVKLRLSTKAIKTLQNKGLEAFAREAGINLNKV